MNFYNKAIPSWHSCMLPLNCENAHIVQEANDSHNARTPSGLRNLAKPMCQPSRLMKTTLKYFRDASARQKSMMGRYGGYQSAYSSNCNYCLLYVYWIRCIRCKAYLAACCSMQQVY